MADLSFTIDSSLAEKLLSSLSFPVRVRVPGDSLTGASSGSDGLGDADLDWTSPNVAEPDEKITAFDARPLLEGLVQAYLEESRNAELVDGKRDSEVVELVSPYASSISLDEPDAVAQVLKRMGDDVAFDGKVRRFFLDRLGARVDWVEAEVTRKPDVAMGNPLTVGKLLLVARAHLTGCILAYGREVCRSVITSWIRFDERSAPVFLDVDGTRVLGRGAVAGIDFVWRIDVLWVTLYLKVGVTRLVNRQLASQRPLLADFGTVVFSVPGVARKYLPTTASVPSSNAETRIDVAGAFSAT